MLSYRTDTGAVLDAVASRLRRIKRQFELTNGCGVNMNLHLRAHRIGVNGGSGFCGVPQLQRRTDAGRWHDRRKTLIKGFV
jgi:Mlc titration factor MtfA (ptsG expression regulator)